MTRIFVDPSQYPDQPLAPDRTLTLSSELTHHLRDVLRLSEGKQITVVCSNSGREFLAIIASATRQAPVEIKIIRELEREIRRPVVATLACGLPKGSHADEICEKVAQLGIDRIVFWLADRCVADPKNIDDRLMRWKKIAEASARQSKRNTIPEVKYFLDSNTFFDWLDSAADPSSDLKTVCSLSSDAKIISDIPAPSGRVHLLVGPEGDFSDNETRQFQARAISPVSLGPLVLRVETAAIVSCAMGLAVWGWR